MRITFVIALLLTTISPTSQAANQAANIDTSNYCVTPIQITLPINEKRPPTTFHLPSGIVSLLYVSDNPSQPIFTELETTDFLMKLNGYKLEPFFSRGSPWPSAILYNTYNDDKGITYLVAKDHRQDQKFMIDELYKFNSETNQFDKVPEKEIAAAQKNLSPKYRGEDMVLQSGQIMNFDYKKNIVTVGGTEVEPILKKTFPFPFPAVLLAASRYFPVQKAVFSQGRKNKVYGTYWWNMGAWERLESLNTTDVAFDPFVTSHILNAPLFFGYPDEKSAEGITGPSNIYYFDGTKTLQPLKPSAVVKTGSLFFLKNMGREFFYSDHKLYELKKDASLTFISLPDSIRKSLIGTIAELPESNSSAIFTENGIYIMDKDLNISPSPLPNSALGPNYSSNGIKSVPYRNEIFVSFPTGPQMLIDTRTSKGITCDEK